ncbi:FxsA family protein [Pseudalkalibacillus caeni]|uniref:Membrane protein FxsA n=1 Tax=Exobacillus caeni TaxID=2574798 RepID=A0A5R9F9F1_9BACL|nr:FxsA family protein [Pseudalkalibacillus caeni]TLS39139.1 membrane protein FxsA [Pseudalkalibacillus caeni]
MLRIFILLLILVPAMEVGLLILSGKTFGVPITVLLIILTGLLGAWLAKKQGTEALRLAQIQMANGEMPGEAILDGLCILVGGVVLLTPGFITDALGFILLFPGSRAIVKVWLRKMIDRMIKNGNFVFIRKF